MPELILGAVIETPNGTCGKCGFDSVEVYPFSLIDDAGVRTVTHHVHCVRGCCAGSAFHQLGSETQ